MSDFVRGTQATFTATFQEFDGSPMVPVDRESWPAVTIRDPESTAVATGIGLMTSEGEYQFGWYVPSTAELSTEDGNDWLIEWALVTTNGHTATKSEPFQVVDKIESTPEERSHTYLTNDGGQLRALLRWPRQLCEVALTVKGSTGASTYLTVAGIATNDAQAADCNPNRLINESLQDGEYLYYYDIAGLGAGEYQLHWSILETPVSERCVQVQIARAVPDLFWHYNVEIRTIIDKLQKSQEMVQAYTDADIFSYLKGGLDLLNIFSPPTNFVLADIPLVGSSGMRTIMIYLSAVYGLSAQQILEVELAFDHSGQTVTLGYNHDYSGSLANLQAMIDRFAESKIHIFRRANGAAFAGARIKNYRFGNRVFKLDGQLRGVVPPGGAAIWRNLGV